MTRLRLSMCVAAFAAFAIAPGCGDEGGDHEVNNGTALPGPGSGAGAWGDAAAPIGPLFPTTGGGTGGTAGTGGTDPNALPPNPGNPLPPNPGATGGLIGGGRTGGTGGATGGGGRFGGLIGGGFTGGFTGGAGGATGGGVDMLPPSGGTDPVIPEIMGECPEFQNGNIMVAGHKQIQITVGQPNKKGAIYFFWHGTGGNAAQVSMVPASVRNEVISSGGIIASFNGNSSSGAAGDCSGTGAHNIADFNAADQIVACAVKNFGVDPRRVYTTGCSAGGLQSGCMAQLRSSYIAASAPNSGGVVFSQKWQNAGKPAIFTMHGGSSDMVGVSFAQTSASLDMAAKQHGSFVVNCNHGGGHCGAPAALYQASWLFMKDHPYGIDSPWKNGIPAGVPDYCKIY